MYQFVKTWQIGGCTIHPGIVIKGEFEETDTTVTVKGSPLLKDIPKDCLQSYTPPQYSPKPRKKSK